MNNNFQKILKKIHKKKIQIAILGVGYVGLKLLLEFAKNKIKVYGIDTDKNKMKILSKNKSSISYIKDSLIYKRKKYTDFSNKIINIKKCDIIIFCLPTPLNSKNEPDLSHIKMGLNKIKSLLRPNQTIILESTSYPGTTKEIIFNVLKKRFNIGQNFFVGYSPERENPGDKKFNLTNIPKIVSGSTNKCKLITDKIYKLIVKKTVKAKSIELAETSKLFENVYRSINIALVNELKFVLNKLNIDINSVIDLAKTKPFGFKEFRPGPGVGGHCIPIDPLYLSWIAKKNGYNTEFIKLASKVNIFTTDNITKQITSFFKKNKLSKKILILGVSYKKNIEDTRESASIKIFEKLKKNKFKVDFTDKLVKKIKIKNKIFKQKNIDYNKIKKYSAIILATDHDYFNYDRILKNSKILFDLRNKYKKKLNNVIKL